ncbi:hypothetical protein PsYK624_049360 [Phanerochaete sordida]|uniref:Uncharacterized protein n=1 Tax=Phanerochaete sordida TaxID=48140 RepID=A0A9P3G7G7_9APHY|nr:hypothetical protein PsYK624_049360 [Phanerochaete sordida]
MHGGKMGIRLADALCLPLPRLNDAKSELKPSEIGTHITLRILWPGYVLWRRKLILNDPTRKAGAMTLEQLAQRIAMQLRDFCEASASLLPYISPRSQCCTEQAKCQESPGEPDWQIVPGCFEELYLIELRHVSQGSWQPVICWDRS